jgi:hypothetical protein
VRVALSPLRSCPGYLQVVVGLKVDPALSLTP